METILKTLAQIPAPAGSEARLCAAIQSFLPDGAVKVDTHGTLIFHKKGSSESTVFLTAMDTPCLYVTYVEGNFARFNATGNLEASVGMPVLCETGEYGIIGEDAGGKFIDTGKNHLTIGMWAVPVPAQYKMGNAFYGGTFMGHYAAITSMILAANEVTEQDAYFVFGTKSHIRQFSPAFLRSIEAKRLFSVETSLANDFPAEKTVFSALESGTALRVKDAAMLSSSALLSLLEDAPFKTYREVSTRTGIGGTAQKAFGGIESAGVGIPIRYLGTPSELVSLPDIENTAHLLAHMLKG